MEVHFTRKLSHRSMYINFSAVKMNPRGTPQQLCSTRVANMNRKYHLQLFGREHFE